MVLRLTLAKPLSTMLEKRWQKNNTNFSIDFWSVPIVSSRVEKVRKIIDYRLFLVVLVSHVWVQLTKILRVLISHRCVKHIKI